MFKKYFIHEFKNSCQMPLTICGISLGISILVAISAMLKLENLLGIGLTALIITIYIFFFMSIHSINKTMTERLFTKNGYLTLTLPVGTHTILISKLLINILYVILYLSSFFLGICIILGGFEVIGGIEEFFEGIGTLFVDIINNLDVVLIRVALALLAFLFFQCSILFFNAFSNSGLLKKQNKGTLFVLAVIFIFLITTIFSIDIIPFMLCYEESTGYFIEQTTESAMFYSSSLLIHFSSLLWMVLGTFGFYFGSYYLIKNKIDVL